MSDTATQARIDGVSEWEFELIAGPYGGRTDAPLWLGEELLFSALSQHTLFSYRPAAGEVTEFRRHVSRLTGLANGPHGELYGAQSGARRIVRFNHDGSTSPMDNMLGARMHNHPDDLAIDRRGRIWFSDPYDPVRARGVQIHGPLDHASVLRLEQNASREWQLVRVTRDTTRPRGVVLSRDETTLYVSENSEDPDGRRELRAYRLDDEGTPIDYAVLHAFGSDARGVHGGIEGMCLDGTGNIVACAGSPEAGPGPMIYVFTPSGRVLQTQIVPGGIPTNCAFGGPDLESLYVTTTEGHLYRVANSGLSGRER